VHSQWDVVVGKRIFEAQFSAECEDTSYVLDGILRIVSRAGVLVELVADSLRWEALFKDAETYEIVNLTTISSEELQRISDKIIVLELIATDCKKGRRGRCSPMNDEIDAEDLTVTIENERYVDDADD
jgi:hypothetical protein